MKVKDISYYLFESFKDAQAKFSQETSEEEVKQYLNKFRELSNRGIISGQEKDIGYWIKQGWNDFREFVDKKSQEPSKSDIKKKKVKKDTDSITLYDNDGVFAVVPLSQQASCYYGKNTNWCTAVVSERNRFEMYFSAMSVPINIFISNDDNQMLISVVYSLMSNTVNELRDSKNNLIKRPIDNYIDVDIYEEILDNLKKNSDKLEKISEQFRLKSPYNASNYAVATKQAFPEGEEIIVQSPYALAYYISRIKTVDSETICNAVGYYLERGIYTNDSSFIEDEGEINAIKRVLDQYTQSNISCVLGNMDFDQVLNLDVSYGTIVNYIKDNDIIPTVEQFEIFLNMELNANLSGTDDIDFVNIEDAVEIVKRLYNSNVNVEPYIDVIKNIDDSQNTLIDIIIELDIKNESIVEEFLNKLQLTSSALIRIIRYAKNGEYIFKYYDFEKVLNAQGMYKAIRMNPEILNVIDNIPQKLQLYIKDNDELELPEVRD